MAGLSPAAPSFFRAIDANAPFPRAPRTQVWMHEKGGAHVESSKRGLCIVFAILAVLYFVFGTSVPTASAVPAFSRKYHTSCQTCHVIFPKLNPFGEAFRLNGYRLPGETPDQVKQTPVSLGAEAYERLWPKMVYPSTLPGNVP